MNEDQPIEAAEREIDLYRAEVTRVTAERDKLREQLDATKTVLQETSRESSQRGDEARKARAVLTEVLGWFGDNGSGRYARVSGTILARAYAKAGLAVPEELRRYQ